MRDASRAARSDLEAHSRNTSASSCQESPKRASKAVSKHSSSHSGSNGTRVFDRGVFLVVRDRSGLGVRDGGGGAFGGSRSKRKLLNGMSVPRRSESTGREVGAARILPVFEIENFSLHMRSHVRVGDSEGSFVLLGFAMILCLNMF